MDGEKENMVNSFHYTVKRDNLKQEVAIGLTSPHGTISVDKDAEYEILGEEGYMFKDKNTGKKSELSWDSL